MTAFGRFWAPSGLSPMMPVESRDRRVLMDCFKC